MAGLYFDMGSSDHEVVSKAEATTGGKLSGRFGLNGVANWFHLLDLSDFDKSFVSNVPLKRGEIIQRYVTITSAIGGSFPLVKINFDRRLVYFLTQEAFDGGGIAFESRGEKALWMRLGDEHRSAA